MANITGAMPKPMHEKAKAGLQDIWMAETKKEAIVAFDLFVETYGVKYERAVKKLTKDRDVLLTFYDFPAEHWKHIRTTNPIESVFATVRNSDTQNQRLPEPQNSPVDGLQTNDVSQEEMAKAQRYKPTARKSFKGLSSRTGSSNFKTPPNLLVTNF